MLVLCGLPNILLIECLNIIAHVRLCIKHINQGSAILKLKAPANEL